MLKGHWNNEERKEETKRIILLEILRVTLGQREYLNMRMALLHFVLVLKSPFFHTTLLDFFGAPRFHEPSQVPMHVLVHKEGQ